MTAPHAEILEGTGEELRRILERFPNDRFRLVPLTTEEAHQDNSGIGAGSGSLYDMLGDYVGCVDGNGENNAARSSELFTEHVATKRREGTL